MSDKVEQLPALRIMTLRAACGCSQTVGRAPLDALPREHRRELPRGAPERVFKLTEVNDTCAFYTEVIE